MLDSLGAAQLQQVKNLAAPSPKRYIGVRVPMTRTVSSSARGHTMAFGGGEDSIEEHYPPSHTVNEPSRAEDKWMVTMRSQRMRPRNEEL